MKRVSFFLALVVTFLLILTPVAGCGQKTNTSTESSTTTITTESTTTTSPTEPTNQASSTISTESLPETSTSSTTTTTTTTTSPSFVPIVWSAIGLPVTLTVDEANNRATYTSGTTDISGYFYKPQGDGPFPAVVVLHGKAGLNETTRAYAAWLATKGYVAFAPDYFAPISMAAGVWAGSDYGKHQERIRTDLGQAIEAMKSVSFIKADCIGVVGFSLGGYFSFWLGTRDDVKAVISYYGAYAPTVIAKYAGYGIIDIVAQIKSPVLMFHGDQDTWVPIDHANTTADLLKSNNKQYEYIIYSGAEHAFGPQYTSGPNAAANTDSQQRALVFLEAKLK
jgi:carboxymethylenebutenolidase